MFSGRPVRPSFAGAGLGGPVAPDVWVLLGVLLTSFSLQFFATTAWLPALLRLTPAVTERGWLWQLVSYPFVGTGQPGFWFVLELLILFMFARDACSRLGRARPVSRKLMWRADTSASAARSVWLTRRTARQCRRKSGNEEEVIHAPTARQCHGHLPLR